MATSAFRASSAASAGTGTHKTGAITLKTTDMEARWDLGAKLIDAKRRHGALVRADGAIMLGDKVGSIHRMGALAQGAEACNGWSFWHVETKKGLRLIDELRAEIRSEMAAG